MNKGDDRIIIQSLNDFSKAAEHINFVFFFYSYLLEVTHLKIALLYICMFVP